MTQAELAEWEARLAEGRLFPTELPPRLCRVCLNETGSRERMHCYYHIPRARHGTVSKYTGACRCDPCKEAMRVYHRAYRQRKKSSSTE